MDTSELRFGGVQKLVLELETRPRTEQFKSHFRSDFLQIAALLLLHQANVFLQTKDGDLPVDLAKDSRMADLLTSQMILCAHRQIYLQSALIYYLQILLRLLVAVVITVSETTFRISKNLFRLLRGAYYNYSVNNNEVQKMSDNKG